MKQIYRLMSIFCLLIISSDSFSQNAVQGSTFSKLIHSQEKRGWTVKDPFRSEVFIENKGQFDKPDGQTLENVKYAINNGDLKVYFTPSGLSYHVANIEFNSQYKTEREEIFEKIWGKNN